LTRPPMIMGPLGIWPWPLLNVLIQFLYALRQLNMQSYQPEHETARTKAVYRVLRDEEGNVVGVVKE